MKFTSKLHTGVAAIAICMAAMPAYALANDPVAEEEVTAIDEIVVTGSRIRRSGTQTPTPTTIVNSDTIQQSGVAEIADLVNEIPSLFVRQNNQTSNQTGNAGLNALDLRGLGTHRTLVLVNGKRRVPAVPGTSAVDVSAIPTSLVERFEVITGGASALYGADAVAGVANFILKKDYEGFEANTSYSNSTRGDMAGYNADFLYGRNFHEGRGNFTLFGSYNNYTETVLGQDRPWTAQGTPAYRLNSADGIYYLTDGNKMLYDSYVAMVELGGHANIWSFNPDGTLRRPVYGPGGLQGTGANSDFYSYRTDGGEFGGRYDDYALAVPSERFNLTTSGKYDLSSKVRLVGDLTYSRTDSSAISRAYSSYGADEVPWYSPFITSEMLAANNGVSENIAFARRFGELGATETNYDRAMYQANIGLEGQFSFLKQDNWNWEATYSFGQTRQDVSYKNRTADNRYRLALDSWLDGSGNAACVSTYYNPGNGCVPLNPFKPLTQEVIDYLQYDASPARHTLDQQVFNAFVSGTLFDLPAGPLQTALGVEYRKEENDIGVSPMYDPNSPEYDASLGITATPLKGDYDVKEVFAELRIPLLADLPMIQQLSLETAGRLSEYSTAGKTESYNFALNWTPVSDIRFRATYGQAVRAPGVSELYTSASRSSSWLADPCNYWDPLNRSSRTEFTLPNCNAMFPRGDLTKSYNDPSVTDEERRNRTYWNGYWQWLPVIYSGNEELKVETATTYTVGVVVQPRFVPNFSLTVDYWDIQLDDAVGSFGAQQIMEKCVDLENPNNMFCGLVDRDPNTNQLIAVNVQQLNMSQFATRGVDFEANYRFQLEQIGMGPEAGSLSISAVYTKLLERSFVLDATDPTTISDSVGLFGSPEWKGVVRTTWNAGPWTAAWSLRHFSPMRPGSHVTPEKYAVSDTGHVFYNDIYASYRVNDKVSVYTGLRNAFDRAPPRLPGAESGGANFEYGYQAGTYDVLGRSFYIGLRMRR